MSGIFIQSRSIALAAALFICGAGIGVMPTNRARADDCLTAPQSTSPKGSHWYYRVDRAKRRNCWYLGPTSLSRQHTAAKVTSAATKDAHAIAVEKPAKASAGALMSTSVGGQQHVQEGGTAPSIPDTFTPPANASLQASVQVAEAAPAVTIVWPDPPAVAPVQAQNPNLVLSDATGGSVLPTVHVRAPDVAEGAARRPGSTSPGPWLGTTFVEILLVVAVGLGVAGALYRVMEIAATRDRRIVNHHSKSDWIASRWPDEWQQYGFVYEGEPDYLQPSLVPAASCYIGRRALRADECEDNSRGTGSASQMSGHEKTLAQLIRDLDQMLQTRKRV